MSTGPDALDINSLRSMSAAEVMTRLASAPTLSSGSHYYPIVDGWVAPDDPAELVRTSRQALVPVLIGYAADEGNYFIANAPKSISEFETFVRHKFPDSSFDSILEMYPAKTDADAPAALGHFFGDYELLTSTVLTARALARRTAVHLYQFSRVGSRSRRMWNGAAHTSDLPYLFDHVTVPSEDFDEQDKVVSAAMAGAWVSFAKRADPNAPDLPQWPAYKEPYYRYLNYSDAIATESGFRKAQIEFCAGVLERARRSQRQ